MIGRVAVVLVVVSACSGAASSPDGPAIDAAGAVDASVADAALGPKGRVTIETRTVQEMGLPGDLVGGIDVVIDDPDGSLYTVTTAADGTAAAELHAGASVTAVYDPTAGRTKLLSFTSVAPGDHLTFGESWRSTLPTAGTMKVTFPEIDRFVVLHSRCGSPLNGVVPPATSVDLVENPHCAPATQSAYLFAYDPQNLLTHTASLVNVAFHDGGAIDVPRWDPVGAVAVDVHGLPPEVTRAQLSLGYVGDGGDVFVGEPPSDAPAAGAVTRTIPWSPVGDALVVTADFDSALGAQVVYAPTAADATTFTLADPITLPWLASFALNAAAQTVTYHAVGGQPYDTSEISLDYGDAALGVEWRIFAAPGHDGSNVVRIPRLPASRHVPLAPANAFVDVQLLDLTVDAGYADVRARPSWETDRDSVPHPPGGLRVSFQRQVPPDLRRARGRVRS